jgi:hypothetical protein
MPPEPTDFSRLFNQGESVLWFAIAITLLVRPVPRLVGTSWKWLLPLCFVVFGISDVIEAQTGAWWHPWWLFVTKALCVLGFLGAFWKARKR